MHKRIAVRLSAARVWRRLRCLSPSLAGPLVFMPLILHKSCQKGNIAISAIILKNIDALFAFGSEGCPLLPSSWRDAVNLAHSVSSKATLRFGTSTSDSNLDTKH